MARSSTIRKAAILIKYLDPRSAEGLLRQLPRAEAEQLRDAARMLDDVDPIEQQEVLDEFLRQNTRASRSTSDHGVELAGSLALGADEDLPSERSVSPIAASARPASPFQFLHDSETSELARMLEHEHPQTIALVLAHLASDRASEVLLSLPKSLQSAVVRRLADLDEANPAALEAVKRNLETRLQAHLEGKKRRAAGVATIQHILRAAGPIAEHELRRTLAQHEDLAELLGETRVVQQSVKSAPSAIPARPTDRLFEDLATLGDHDLLRVVRAADGQHLRLALAGGSVRFAERVLKLLPGRDSKALRRSLQTLGTLRISDIEDAQDELIRMACDLETGGAIEWPDHLAVGGVAR